MSQTDFRWLTWDNQQPVDVSRCNQISAHLSDWQELGLQRGSWALWSPVWNGKTRQNIQIISATVVICSSLHTASNPVLSFGWKDEEMLLVSRCVLLSQRVLRDPQLPSSLLWNTNIPVSPKLVGCCPWGSWQVLEPSAFQCEWMNLRYLEYGWVWDFSLCFFFCWRSFDLSG